MFRIACNLLAASLIAVAGCVHVRHDAEVRHKITIERVKPKPNESQPPVKNQRMLQGRL